MSAMAKTSGGFRAALLIGWALLCVIGLSLARWKGIPSWAALPSLAAILVAYPFYLVPGFPSVREDLAGAPLPGILIASSVTVVLAWASLKMRQWAKYKIYMGITIACGLIFLIVKLSLEWPAKFVHFGAFIKKDKWEQYDEYLGNKHLAKEGRPPRPEITGHLHEVEIDTANADSVALETTLKERDLKVVKTEEGKVLTVEMHSPRDAEMLARVPGVKLVAFEVQLDEVNADPDNPENDRPHFIPRDLSQKIAKIEAADVSTWSAFAPKHSPYFAVYFTITGLHGLHVLAGVLVFCHFFIYGERLYRKNPEHMANRVEVGGLFWHFVDLVWIFVFPIFYLL